MKTNSIWFFSSIILASINVFGANYYVRSGATGTNTGLDWTNAYSSLPKTLTRNNTYYIANGTYSGKIFDVPESGTQIITIKGATSTDHGTDIGWNNIYSVEKAPAIWTSGVVFNTSYWIFDGSIGSTWSKNPKDYGFHFEPTDFPISVFNVTRAISNITLSHIFSKAPVEDIEKYFVGTGWETKSVHNVTVSHCLADGWENTVKANSPGLPMNNWLVEYNVIINGSSTPKFHGEDINNNYGYVDNLTIRYNWFEGRTTGTASIVCLNAPCGNFYIYGNVFKKMAGGDGIITGVHYPLNGEIYNNTFIDVDNGYGNGLWIGHDVSANVYNNLIYSSIASIGGNFTGKKDYNAYFNSQRAPTEPHGQIGTGSPFVNEPANDLRLKSPSNAGMTIAQTNNSTGNRDVFGIIRGADGLWDRGALEFGTTNNSILSPPQNLRIQF